MRPARKKSRHEPAAAEQPVPQDACPTTVTLKTHNQKTVVIPTAEASQPQKTARKTGKGRRNDDEEEEDTEEEEEEQEDADREEGDENVNEKVYRQAQPPKTLWRIYEAKSAPLLGGTKRSKVTASDTDLGNARTRHVSCTLLPTRDIDAVAQLIRDSADRVVFVHGESGSGKTVCATRAANCFNDPVVAFYIRCDAPEADWTKSERDAQARAYVKAKVAAALGCRPGVTCTTTTRVVIILDEMGQHPQLARGICATHRHCRRDSSLPHA